MAKAPKGTNLTPTLVSRIAKKSASISTNKVKPSDLPHDIIIEAVQAVELIGYIADRNDNSVTIRHKKGHGSSSQLVSTFGQNQIISVLGNAGEHGSVLALIPTPVRVYQGFTLKFSGDTIIATSIETSEVIHINTRVPGHTVRCTVNETAAAKKYEKYGVTAAKKKDKAAVKPSKIKNGKKSKKGNDEDF